MRKLESRKLLNQLQKALKMDKQQFLEMHKIDKRVGEYIDGEVMKKCMKIIQILEKNNSLESLDEEQIALSQADLLKMRKELIEKSFAEKRNENSVKILKVVKQNIRQISIMS